MHITFLLLTLSPYLVKKVDSLTTLTQKRQKFCNKPSVLSKLGTARFATPDENREVSDDVQVFSQRQRLKEETEAPFRNVRLFFYTSLIGAAGLSSFISITKLIFTITQTSSTSAPLPELVANLAINIAGVAFFSFLYQSELKQRQSKLERIQQGGSLAGLMVRIRAVDSTKSNPSSPTASQIVDNSKGEVVQLSDLRTGRGFEKRVVIVVAPSDALQENILQTLPLVADIARSDLIVVPWVISAKNKADDAATQSESYALQPLALDYLPPSSSPPHLAQPVSQLSWKEVLDREIKAMLSQGGSLDRGFSLIIKKNGKVGSRVLGLPVWASLVGQVQERDRLGMDNRNV